MPACVRHQNVLYYLQQGEPFFIEQSSCFGGMVERPVRLVLNANNEIWYSFPDSFFKGFYRPAKIGDDGFIYIGDDCVYIL